jgi:osmotically-inducible protein OsmY
MKYAIVPVAAAMILSSCTPVGLATGAAAGAGVAVAQEGGISQAASDARIQIEINDLWFKYNVEMFRKLSMTVKGGRVLITGIVQNPEYRVEAVRLAWQPKGVKQVINEIRVAKSEGIVGYAKDTWISTSLRTQMTFDKEVQSINYSIDTVAGTVYLMGVAQSQLELNRVVQIARTIKGVKGVVSYVKLAGTGQDAPVQPGGANTGQAGFQGDPDFAGHAYTQGQSYEARPGEPPAGAPTPIVPLSDTPPPADQTIEREILD